MQTEKKLSDHQHTQCHAHTISSSRNFLWLPFLFGITEVVERNFGQRMNPISISMVTDTDYWYCVWICCRWTNTRNGSHSCWHWYWKLFPCFAVSANDETAWAFTFTLRLLHSLEANCRGPNFFVSIFMASLEETHCYWFHHEKLCWYGRNWNSLA